ncbi:MAG: ATP-binding protein [Deltaproteobacteria bacterium]|nr:ATP-binding protein [Deltaproteobacteria bacterium]
MQKNPFTLKEIPADAAFCNREKEISDLLKFAAGNTNILLYSPRRYGKTSLIKRVQNMLTAEGTITAYCDLFGVTSVEEIAGKIAKSIYLITRRNENLFKKSIRFLTSFRPVLSPEPDGGISISVQPAYKTVGLDLLDETLASLENFINDVDMPVHIVLDEFQEITEVDNAVGIEGTLRHHIQKIQCAFVFVGSRRRILLDMFNNRKRPFFQSAVNYELKALPVNDLVGFIVSRFEANGKHISPDAAAQICELLHQHPYYVQKFCFLLYDHIDKRVTPGDIIETYQWIMESEKALFESTLRQLTARQIALLTAIAGEPAGKLYSADYMARHSLGSTGGIQRGLNVLSKEDLIEKQVSTGKWQVVDPVLKEWLIKRRL